MRHLLIFIILFSLGSCTLNAGDLPHEELSLKALFGRLYKTPSDSLRSLVNDSICSQLSTTLQSDSSFTYAFDSLPYLGKVYSTDRQLRIYSWNYISNDGDYRFCSYFQFPYQKLIRLIQNRPGYLPDENRIIDAPNWYGALYYNAIPITFNDKIHYLLLGWSQYFGSMNFKVIDVLSTTNDTLSLGRPIFAQHGKISSRIVLPYSSGHSMALQYDGKRNLIIFSHLNSEASKDNKIPDESFSGFQLTRDQLIYKDDVTFDHHEILPTRTKVEYGLEGLK